MDEGGVRWRHCCGSFVVNGHFGTTNDYMLSLFIDCTLGGFEPLKITMGAGVYLWFRQAQLRHSHFIAKQLSELLADTAAWHMSCHHHAVDTERDVATGMRKLLSAMENDWTYNGASVEVDPSIEPDVMLYWRHGRLVGETTGWTA